MFQSFSRRVALLGAAMLLFVLAWECPATYALLGRLGLVEETNAELTWSTDASGPNLIMHAGGRIDGNDYTNSLEAVEASLARGFRLIELDLRKTLNGDYFGAHKIREFNRMTDRPARGIIPPTTGQVAQSRILGRYTPVLLRELGPLFQGRPERMLVVDKAWDFKAILRDFPLPEQLIVEVGSPGEYFKALSAGLKHVVVNTTDWHEIETYGYRMVLASPAFWTPENIERAKALGIRTFAASLPECEAAKGLAVDFVYVDVCRSPLNDSQSSELFLN